MWDKHGQWHSPASSLYSWWDETAAHSVTELTWRIQQVCLQLPTYADNVALPAFARFAPCTDWSTSCRPGLQQQTPSCRIAAVSPCWDRQTDVRQMHRRCFAQHAGRQCQQLQPLNSLKHAARKFGKYQTLLTDEREIILGYNVNCINPMLGYKVLALQVTADEIALNRPTL